jgi:small subunit ribosomal protein S20
LANIASQIKRNRQNEKRRLRNRDARGAARSAVKGALANMSGEQPSAAGVDQAVRLLDRAARKGAIHRRNAARRKSRLLKRMSALGLQRPGPAKAGPSGAEDEKAPKSEAGATTPKKAAKRASKKSASAE